MPGRGEPIYLAETILVVFSPPSLHIPSASHTRSQQKGCYCHCYSNWKTGNHLESFLPSIPTSNSAHGPPHRLQVAGLQPMLPPSEYLCSVLCLLPSCSPSSSIISFQRLPWPLLPGTCHRITPLYILQKHPSENHNLLRSYSSIRRCAWSRKTAF